MFAHGDREWPGISKLVEECGEVLQIAGKLMQTHGSRDHWDGSDLQRRLLDEIADLQAAITFVTKTFSLVDQQEFSIRVGAKLALFNQWHDIGIVQHSK